MKLITNKNKIQIISSTLANFIIARQSIYDANLETRIECERIEYLINNTHNVLSIFNAEGKLQKYL